MSLTNANFWISLVTLTALEIVLGIDNIIFITILAGKLPAGQQGRARTMGLSLALITAYCSSARFLAHAPDCSSV